MNEPVIIGDATLWLGDCMDVLKTIADASVDSVVCDPPYHLTQTSRRGHARTNNPDMPHGRHRIGDKGFMGKVWDGGDIAHRIEMWAECLRVLKPGGHLFAFSSTRTYHRMTCAIEDAGLEVRDQFAWVYGQGFPKSKNLSGDWQGWGTAAKPAWEPIALARKPFKGSVEANVQRHGTGALNIDACRIAAPEGSVVRMTHYETGAERGYDGGIRGGSRIDPQTAGRWPANLIHDGSPAVLEAFAQFGNDKGQAAYLATRNSDKTRNTFGEFAGTTDANFAPHDAPGSAARFFYCAKASRADRNEGIGGSDTPAVETEATMRDRENADWQERNGNHHPTVKPTDLMAYLCRLVTPPNGLVLDHFMGSGSTGKAAIREGFRFVGIDMTPEYVDIAKARIQFEIERVMQERARAEQERIEAARQPDMFAESA